MAVTFLKAAVQDALGPKKSIIDIMRKELGGWSPARSHETVHASDITKDSFCPRQTALLTVLKAKKKDEYISTALQATFDIGNEIGDLFCEEWAGQHVWGNWRCSRCDSLVTFKQKPINVPCKCGGKCEWKYEEVKFVSQQYQISGSLDAIMDLGAPKLFVTELKIMAVDAFEKLVAPLAEHRIRTNLYLNLVENSSSAFNGRINTKEARVFYVSRGFGKKHPDYNEILPFKEFKVERDDSSLAPYLKKAEEVVVFKKTGAIPHGICKTSMDSPAKKCSVCKQCFSGKYPATQKE